MATYNSASIITDNFISHFFFKKDKNYILKEAQMESTSMLCLALFEKTIVSYGTLFNPLGIIDDTTKQILNYRLKESAVLEGIYENLAAIYRFQYGTSQLEIIWDGKSHFEKFTDDWTKVYGKWIAELCQSKTFVKGILHLTVFNTEGKNTVFIENSLKAIINEYFDLKVLTRRGVKKLYVKIPLSSKAS